MIEAKELVDALGKAYLSCCNHNGSVEPEMMWVSSDNFEGYWRMHESRSKILISRNQIKGMQLCNAMMKWSVGIPNDVVILIMPDGELHYRKLE